MSSTNPTPELSTTPQPPHLPVSHQCSQRPTTPQAPDILAATPETDAPVRPFPLQPLPAPPAWQIKNYTVIRMLKSTEIDPEEEAELTGLIPHDMNVSLYSSETALVCTLLRPQTVPVILPSLPTKEACVRALFNAASCRKSYPHSSLFIAHIDYGSLRLCLVSYHAVYSKESHKFNISLSAVESAHLQPQHCAYSALEREVAILIKIFLRSARPSASVFLLTMRRGLKRLKLSLLRKPMASINGTQALSQNVRAELSRHRSEKPEPAKGRLLSWRMGVSVGLFRRTTYEIDSNGGFIVEERSSLRNEQEGATIEAGVTVSPMPAGHVCVEKKLPGSTFRRVGGQRALHSLLLRIEHNRRLRVWFLSMLLTGMISTCPESKADGFIPNCIERKEDGLVFDRPIPGWYFEELGGSIFNMGDDVFFKPYSQALCKAVTGIEAHQVIVSKEETGTATDGCVQYWGIEGLEVGLWNIKSNCGL